MGEAGSGVDHGSDGCLKFGGETFDVGDNIAVFGEECELWWKCFGFLFASFLSHQIFYSGVQSFGQLYCNLSIGNDTAAVQIGVYSSFAHTG